MDCKIGFHHIGELAPTSAWHPSFEQLFINLGICEAYILFSFIGLEF